MAATRDALAERLQSVRDTASLLYNRMMKNMGYRQQETLKDIVEKEVNKEEQQQQEEEGWCKDPWVLKFIPDYLKTEEMCIKALRQAYGC